MKQHPQAAGEPDRVLWIIYGAMVSGVLLFAAVVRFVMPAREIGSGLDTVAWVAPVLAVLAVFSAGFVRGRLRAGADDNARRAAAIIVWSFAEGAALFGLVIVLVTGTLYPAGLGVLIAFLTMAYCHPGRFR